MRDARTFNVCHSIVWNLVQRASQSVGWFEFEEADLPLFPPVTAQFYSLASELRDEPLHQSFAGAMSLLA